MLDGDVDALSWVQDNGRRICAVGAPEVSNRQAWESLLNQGKDRLYEIAIRGDGVMPAMGGCPPCSDARVKAAVDYMIEIATTETKASSTPTRQESQ